MDARHDPQSRPPPAQNAEKAPDWLRRHFHSGQQDQLTDTRVTEQGDEANGTEAGPELESRRLGHDSESCTTCARAEVLIASRRRREIQALTDARRIIDLRGDS